MRALACVIVAVASAASAQPVFKSGVELVTVPITVTSAARDQLITAGLEAGDFRIFEGDEPQPITSLSQERRPVSVCFVVDTEADFAAMSLLNELKYQYVLAYSPMKPFDGKYRRIRVETTVKGLAVRHRGGYLAIPSTPQ